MASSGAPNAPNYADYDWDIPLRAAIYTSRIRREKKRLVVRKRTRSICYSTNAVWKRHKKSRDPGKLSLGSLHSQHRILLCSGKCE